MKIFKEAITFTYKTSTGVTLILEVKDEFMTCENVVEEFQKFLLGCGFSINSIREYIKLEV